MAVQLILYPQVYDGYYQYTSPTQGTGANNAGTGTVSTNPYLAPILTPELNGNALFNNGMATGIATTINTGTATTMPSNEVALRTAPAPIGHYRLSHSSDIPAANAPYIQNSKLHLTNTNTVGSTSIAYTTINGLQQGNSYRVLITIESAPVGKLEIGATGATSWEQPDKMNGLARMAQLGGRQGTVEARQDFINATTGANIGNPLRTAITTPTRVYQNFIAQGSTEVLQVSYQGTATTTPAIITQISVVASPSNVTPNPNTISGTNNNNVTTTPPVSTVQSFLDDGQVILDLYKDESIPLNLSVDDFTKVDEKIASYSKSFMVPATKHNNKIFSFYFDVTRSQAQDVFFFNPFAKTKAKIKDDTVLIFEGWMKLINVQEKNGQISYNINLYSEPTTFCDYLKVGTMSDLDLTELAHDYTKDTVPKSWDDTIGLPLTNPLPVTSFAYDAALGASNTNVIKYPFINWTGAFTLDDDHTITTGLPENTFRPVINCKYLLDRLFEATPFSYESNFLNGSIFKKAYMDYNWGEHSTMLATTFVQSDQQKWAIENTGGSWDNIVMPITDVEIPVGSAFAAYDSSTGVFTMQNDGELMTMGVPRFYRTWFNGAGQWRAKVTPIATGVPYYPNSGSINFNTLMWGGGSPDCSALDGTNAPITLASDAQCGAGRISSLWLIFNLQAGDTVEFQFQKSGGGGSIWLSTNEQVSSWKQDFLENNYNNPEQQKIMYMVTGGLSNISFLQSGKRAQLKQYDFWLGIKNMFNLVTMPSPTTPQHLIIEPYADIFLNNPDSKQIDWTSKVDASNIKIQPLNKIPKETVFTYEEDESDYRVTQYKNALGGYLYGAKTWEAGSQFFSLLTGSKTVSAKPFAPTMTAPLTMLFPDFICSHIYKADDEGTFASFDNKPRILFDEGLKYTPNNNTGVQLEYVVWWGLGFLAESYTEYGRMSHLTEQNATSPTTQDLNFGECPLVQPVGTSPTDNLFNTYWLPYYEALYNPDCRMVTLKMRLTPKDIAEWNFYDTIMVKNREYRVNKIEYNSGVLAKVQLILIP